MIFSTINKHEKAMQQARCYDEWKDAAIAHDKQSGAATWRKAENSGLFDYKEIKIRLNRLTKYRLEQDNRSLLFTLNEGIHGNVGGIGNPKLYSQSQYSTKELVVEYVEEIVSALQHLADPDVDDISVEEKLDFFRRAHHCFGRSAFLMSGSGTLLYFHVGVVKELLAQQLMPQIISGSSGGALIGSIIGANAKDDLAHLLSADNLNIELPNKKGFIESFGGLLPEVIPIERVHEIVARLVPDLTFQEAFNVSHQYLNVPIAPAEKHQTSRLMNAITSPNVYVRDALLASTAVPGVYPEVTLMAKNELGERQPYLNGRKWVDGSVSEDIPAKRLSRLYGANHYIVSQTNPVVMPFLNDLKEPTDLVSKAKNAGFSAVRAYINTSYNIMQKPLSISPTLSKLSKFALSMVNQDYIGDINILPEQRFFNLLNILSPKSQAEIEQLIRSGQQSTWPKIEMIRVQTRISTVLENILSEYEEKFLHYGSSAVKISNS